MTSTALTLSREAISLEQDVKGHAPPGGSWAGRPGDSFSRWEPWVRQNAIVQELMSELQIGAATQPASSSGARTKTSRYLCSVRVGKQSLVELECPTEAEFMEQLRMVLGWSELRAERRDEILAQMQAPYAFIGSVAGLRADQHRFTFELLACAMQVAALTHMRLKAEFAAWRPNELSPQVQPMISTPGHGSFPSGHATEIFTCVTLLNRLFASGGAQARTSDYLEALEDQLRRLAVRVATNRVVAGVHFPVDSAGGCLLGQAVSHYVLAAAGLGGHEPRGYRFSVDGFLKAGGEFGPSSRPKSGGGADDGADIYPPLKSTWQVTGAHELLKELARRAQAELCPALPEQRR